MVLQILDYVYLYVYNASGGASGTSDNSLGGIISIKSETVK